MGRHAERGRGPWFARVATVQGKVKKHGLHALLLPMVPAGSRKRGTHLDATTDMVGTRLTSQPLRARESRVRVMREKCTKWWCTVCIARERPVSLLRFARPSDLRVAVRDLVTPRLSCFR